jgi:pyruvate kinase
VIGGRPRQTRIIATLGPSSRDPAVLRRMMEEGLDWARLSYSHGDPEEQLRAAETVRAVAAVAGRRVRLMAQLGGPKVRIGALPEPIEARPGQVLTLGSGREVPDAIPITVPQVLAHRTIGETLAVADGAVELEVIEADRGWVRCRVALGGVLRSYQGVAVLDAHEGHLPPITAKDYDDLTAALAVGVDAVCLSMVRRREDVWALRARVPDGVKVVAKVENAHALADIDSIVAAADAIVLARAGLTCGMPRAEVPLAQKAVLARCAAHGRMAIVATELLCSMVERPRPTRAEISDVTTALLDGADALMLSEETAVGAHPIDAVAELRQVVETVEASPWYLAARPRRSAEDEG